MGNQSDESQVLSSKMKPLWYFFLVSQAGVAGGATWATDGGSLFGKQRDAIELLEKKVEYLEAQVVVRRRADKKLLKNHRQALEFSFSQNEILREMLEDRLPKSRRSAWRDRAAFHRAGERRILSDMTLADEN